MTKNLILLKDRTLIYYRYNKKSINLIDSLENVVNDDIIKVKQEVSEFVKKHNLEKKRVSVIVDTPELTINSDIETVNLPKDELKEYVLENINSLTTANFNTTYFDFIQTSYEDEKSKGIIFGISKDIVDLIKTCFDVCVIIDIIPFTYIINRNFGDNTMILNGHKLYLVDNEGIFLCSQYQDKDEIIQMSKYFESRHFGEKIDKSFVLQEKEDIESSSKDMGAYNYELLVFTHMTSKNKERGINFISREEASITNYITKENFKKALMAMILITFFSNVVMYGILYAVRAFDKKTNTKLVEEMKELDKATKIFNDLQAKQNKLKSRAEQVHVIQAMDFNSEELVNLMYRLCGEKFSIEVMVLSKNNIFITFRSSVATSSDIADLVKRINDSGKFEYYSIDELDLTKIYDFYSVSLKAKDSSFAIEDK